MSKNNAIDEIIVEIRAELGDFRKDFKSFAGELDSGVHKLGKSGSGLNHIVEDLGKTFLAAFTAEKLFEGIKESIRAFEEEDRAITQLKSTIKTMGRDTDLLFDKLHEQASRLQEEGIFPDADILRSQAILATFGKISDDNMSRATQAVVDFSAAFGIDLPNAARAFGAASEGTAGLLGRYGIKLDEAKIKTQGFGYVLDEVEKKVSGMNKAIGDQSSSVWTKFANTVSSSMAIIGEKMTNLLSPAVDQLTKDLKTINERFSSNEMRHYTGELANLQKQLDSINSQRADAQDAGIFQKMFGTSKETSDAIIDQMDKIKQAMADFTAVQNEGSRSIGRMAANTPALARGITEASIAAEKLKKDTDELIYSLGVGPRVTAEYKYKLSELSYAQKTGAISAKQHQDQLDKLTEAMSQAGMQVETYTQAMARVARQSEKSMVQKATDDFNDLKGVMEDFGRGVSATMADMVTGGDSSFKELKNRFIHELTAMLIYKNAIEPLLTSFSSSMGKSDGGGIMGTIGSIIGGMMGGSGSSAPAVKAKGGIIPPGGSALVGDQGPELIKPIGGAMVIPMRHDKEDQRKSVNGVVINQTNNITTGVEITVRAEIANAMPRIIEQTKAAIIDAKYRGTRF